MIDDDYLDGYKMNNASQLFEGPVDNFRHCMTLCGCLTTHNDIAFQCGAWSFDKNTKLCTLHSMDTCCNPVSPIESPSSLMGYRCPAIQEACPETTVEKCSAACPDGLGGYVDLDK